MNLVRKAQASHDKLVASLIPMDVDGEKTLLTQTKKRLRLRRPVETWNLADVDVCEKGAIYASSNAQKRLWQALARIIESGISAQKAAVILDVDFRVI